MTKGATLGASFQKQNRDILVDLKFDDKKNQQKSSFINEILGLREESSRKRRGCPWNPLNLLGATGFKNGKDIISSEREELQKRVHQIERKLCYISEKIDQCEQSRIEEDNEETDAKGEELEPEQPPESESEPDLEPEEKTNTGKSSQNFMVLLRQQKMKRQCQNPGKFCIEKYTYKETTERPKKNPTAESKSVVWSSKPYLQTVYQTSNDNCSFMENKTANLNKLINQGRTTYKSIITDDGDSPKHQYNSQSGDQIKGNRILSSEMVTKKNIKMIIDEAVVDSIGRTLHKYFKEGLEKYIKNRVESAVHVYSEVDPTVCYTPQTQTQTSFSSRPKSKKSIEDIYDYQSTVKSPENITRKSVAECSVKTFCSDGTVKTFCSDGTTIGTDSVTTESRGRNKFQRSSTPVSSKYTDIRTWINKRQRQRFKPVSARSEASEGTESNKTIQIIKGNTTRHFPYHDRAFQRKFVRRRFSKETLT